VEAERRVVGFLSCIGRSTALEVCFHHRLVITSGCVGEQPRRQGASCTNPSSTLQPICEGARFRIIEQTSRNCFVQSV
jgi:hypothetical protein